MKDVIEYSGYVDTTSKETIEIKNSENIDCEFRNRYLSKILDTPYYMDVNYLFSYEKVKNLFDNYKKTYGVEKEFSGDKYTIYHEWENGGVSEVYLSDKIEKKELEEKVFSASISLQIDNGKSYDSMPFYKVEFFHYREEKGNFFGYISVNSADLVVTVLREFTECIEGLDSNDIFDTIHELCTEIKETSSSIDKLRMILRNN